VLNKALGPFLSPLSCHKVGGSGCGRSASSSGIEIGELGIVRSTLLFCRWKSV